MITRLFEPAIFDLYFTEAVSVMTRWRCEEHDGRQTGEKNARVDYHEVVVCCVSLHIHSKVDVRVCTKLWIISKANTISTITSRKPWSQLKTSKALTGG